jgi:UDP-3-O-[3-hydroxymyristoyl] glucosamine N-acyltransferase
MQFTAQQIAALIQGSIEGTPDATIRSVAKIEEATEGTLSFVANPKYEEYLYSSKASVIIVNEGLSLQQPVEATLIRVKDAYAAFALLLQKYNEMMAGQKKRGVEHPAFISASARIAEDAYIGAFSYVGDGAEIKAGAQVYPGAFVGDRAIVGEGSILYPGVKLYHECVLGARVTVHSGTVIGSDGFGFAPQADGSYKKVPQIGNVLVEDDVEIGANTTIDRATMGSTVIRRGVKLDNLIQIAHNVEVGQHTAIAAQTGISGSTKIGAGCLIGGQVGIVGHIRISSGTKINAQSGLAKSVTEENTALNGSPAFDYKSSLKSAAVYRNLPDIQQRLIQLEETVRLLTDQLKGVDTSRGV